MSIVSSIFDRLTGDKAKTSVDIVRRRFLQVFLDHGIEVSQIPRFYSKVQLADLQAPDRLVKIITPAVLDEVAALFGVRVEWLEGIDDQIYEHLSCYKHPIVILDHLRSLLIDDRSKQHHPLRVLCSDRKLNRSSGSAQYLVPVIVEKITDLGETEVFRYNVYQDGFSWGYDPARMELKVIARIVFQHLGIPVSLFEVDQTTLMEIMEGRSIPGPYLRGCQISDPSLEDYALSPEESGVAKEVDELQLVMARIKEEGLLHYSFVEAKASAKTEPSTVLICT